MIECDVRTAGIGQLRQGLEKEAVASTLGCAAVDVVANAQHIVQGAFEPLALVQFLACAKRDVDLRLQLLELQGM